MLRVIEFQLYELATRIHPLTSVTHEVKYSQIWYDWYQARTALETWFQQRALEVCLQAVNELYTAIDAVVPRDLAQAVAKLPTDTATEQPIGWIANNVKIAADKFETVIAAELSNSDTYWILPKGTHKTSMLLQCAHMELSALVLAEIPEVKSDIDEAGKCLLFDTPTAAGFHLLRATEAAIRKYCKVVTGKEPAVKSRNWGAYIKGLRYNTFANRKIIDSIDQIKEHFPNPILHPQANLSAEDAQVLFGLCVSIITLIVGDMKVLAHQPTATLPFPCGGITKT